MNAMVVLVLQLTLDIIFLEEPESLCLLCFFVLIGNTSRWVFGAIIKKWSCNIFFGNEGDFFEDGDLPQEIAKISVLDSDDTPGHTGVDGGLWSISFFLDRGRFL